ncbi:hypothetical protein DRP53_09595 [candidate division WOR-3 bacterium]|uniref:DDH domain-containing protein n=1 Tax=candidate division WOR-3 bacterium TaxID=2052148 RepID=A0A660SFL8_UNCW3|nr:MAG: hypothetical protein DRP53_09595 [candidate division WOR-3 bacterium]
MTLTIARVYSDVDLELIEQKLSVGKGTSRFLSQCFSDLEEMRRYLEPKITDLHPPELLPNIDHLTDLLLIAIDRGAGVFVWGHDDIDGHTATALMVKTLHLLNARVGYHIPDKRKEGYTIPVEWISRLKEEGFTTIVTVDFGSSSSRILERCREHGISLLVTDHHEVLYRDGVQVNPKFPGSRYPERELAGVGVSMKVAQHLATNILGISIEEFYELNPDFLILGLLGSVADRMPLFGESRTIILLGLEEYRRSPLGWVKALHDEGPPDYSQIIYRIIPILASGRGDQAVEFYLCNDYDRARSYITAFKEQQRNWQNGYSRHLPSVLRSVKVYPNFALAVVPNLPLEFLGSFANRLKDEFKRPSMVVTRRNGEWVAELRGIGSVDLVKELSPLREELTDFGGHPLACGLSFPDQLFESVTSRIITLSDRFHGATNRPKEIELPISAIDDSLRKIFPLSRDFVFLSPKTSVERGKVSNRRVVWNTSPPADGIYDLYYVLDEDLNIYIREVKCPR